MSLQGQRFFGPAGITLVVAFVTALLPTSIDLYLPALPRLSQEFNTSEAAVNLTLILYFLGMAGSMLFWGPLSDKYGRKPVLLAGLTLFTASSLACAAAGSIHQLILFRVLQSLGAGAGVAVNNAILKDVFSGRERERALATVITLILIAPVLAPTLGGFLLQYMSWRGLFLLLGVFGSTALGLSLLLGETIQKRQDRNLLATLARMGAVLKNPRFTFLLAIFSSPMLPAMAFVAASSYIFIQDFGLSEVQYGLYYMVISLFRILGPYLYIFLSRFIPTRHIITAGFSTTLITGILLATFGPVGPISLAASIIPLIPAGPMLRPPGVNLMLEQQDLEDAGSASSVINAAPFMFGGTGMLLISLGMQRPILFLSLMCAIIGAATTFLWLLAARRPFVASVLER
ncbi:MAG: multidrug effflux MFS transporter [Desulfohalobiaceae bacterium]|nr:multidrug effflux MFS transporter [Desulfohalobiaceae bacterium]